MYVDGNFIMGVPLGEIPEYSIDDKKTGEFIKRGWRPIFGLLLKDRYIKPSEELRRWMGTDDMNSWYYNRHSAKRDIWHKTITLE